LGSDGVFCRARFTTGPRPASRNATNTGKSHTTVKLCNTLKTMNTVTQILHAALFGERSLAKKIFDYAEDLNAVDVIENIRGETGMLEIVGLLEPHLNREDVCRDGFRKLLEEDFLRDSKRMKNGFASGKLIQQMTDWMNQVLMAATRSHESNTHIQSMGCVILKRLIEKEPDTTLNARVQFLFGRLKGSLESAEVQVEAMRALDTQMHVRVYETAPLVTTNLQTRRFEHWRKSTCWNCVRNETGVKPPTPFARTPNPIQNTTKCSKLPRTLLWSWNSRVYCSSVRAQHRKRRVKSAWPR